MATQKGAYLEELVRAYFAKQGFFVLRSVPYRYDGNEITDLDVWFYSRQAASVRIRGIADVKNKKSPKAFERVLWIKGVQAALNCDRAVIATTDANPAIKKFAESQRIAVLAKSFVERLGKILNTDGRLTLEQFAECVQLYPAHKQDGDWLRMLADAKSAVASRSGFPAFNKAMFVFRFFAERAEVRVQHREQAIRCALLTSGLACIALDSALERFVYDNKEKRFSGLLEGVTYGDAGDGRARENIDTALAVLSEGIPNGKTISAQAREQLNRRLSEIRADVVAEYFMREHNAQHLFPVAKELDDVAHSNGSMETWRLSLEARSILGVFADFVGVKRSALPVGSAAPDSALAQRVDATEKSGGNADDSAASSAAPPQQPLL